MNYKALRKVAKPGGGHADVGDIFEMTEDQAVSRVGLVELVKEVIEESAVVEEKPSRKKVKLKKSNKQK